MVFKFHRARSVGLSSHNSDTDAKAEFDAVGPKADVHQIRLWRLLAYFIKVLNRLRQRVLCRICHLVTVEQGINAVTVASGIFGYLCNRWQIITCS